MKRFPRLRPSPWDAAVVLMIVLAALGTLLFRVGSGTAAGGVGTTADRAGSGTTGRAGTGTAGYAGEAADHAGVTALVYADSAEMDRVRLEQLEQPEVRVYHSNGYTVEAEYDADGVQVVFADCPSQICVYTGRISHSGQAIICLPAHIVILLEGAAETDAPDAVLG